MTSGQEFIGTLLWGELNGIIWIAKIYWEFGKLTAWVFLDPILNRDIFFTTTTTT